MSDNLRMSYYVFNATALVKTVARFERLKLLEKFTQKNLIPMPLSYTLNE